MTGDLLTATLYVMWSSLFQLLVKRRCAPLISLKSVPPIASSFHFCSKAVHYFSMLVCLMVLKWFNFQSNFRVEYMCAFQSVHKIGGTIVFISYKKSKCPCGFVSMCSEKNEWRQFEYTMCPRKTVDKMCHPINSVIKWLFSSNNSNHLCQKWVHLIG